MIYYLHTRALEESGVFLIYSIDMLTRSTVYTLYHQNVFIVRYAMITECF